MKTLRARLLSMAVVLCATPMFTPAQEVVDRIVARVENNIVLWSELRQLSRYQQLLGGKSESDTQLLERLIDQWIVRTEAETSRFPHPSDADINQGFDRLIKSFASPQDFESQKIKNGLDDSEIKSIIASELYFTNYLDSRFRSSVQVDSEAIADFYYTNIVPAAKARGQSPPTLEASIDSIREALIQRGINSQSDRWLKESRASLHVERFLEEGPK
ncbi:MAG: hypothetical protein NVS9B4_06450 [Candidatus Acidiferrum sp.]